METQKIANLLNDSDNECSKFAAKKWYHFNDQDDGQYGEGNASDSNDSILKQKSLNQVFLITQMHIFLWKEIKQLHGEMQLLKSHSKTVHLLEDV